MITVNKANPTPGEITSSLTGFSGDGGGLNLANNGYIDLANNAAAEFGTADFSIEFVLNQTGDNTDDNYIYTSHVPGNNRFYIWNDISDNKLNLLFADSSGSATTKVLDYDMSADYGTPTHYVIAADRSGVATLYKNGNSVAAVDISSTASIDIGSGNANAGRLSAGTGYGVLGTFYRFRAFNTLADAKLLFERADVPQTLTANLLFDLDLAFANPTQSLTVQDRKGNTDGTASSSTLVSQVQPVVQLNSTSARIGTSAATPADGDVLIGGNAGIGGGTDTSTFFGKTLAITDAGNCGVVFKKTTGTTKDYSVGVKSDGTFNVVDGGNPRLTIDASGNVSVNASGADAVRTLNVHGTNGASELYTFAIEADGANAKTNFKVGSGGGAAATKLSIDASGNLTLGTPAAGSAAAMFHISGAAPRIRLEDTSAPANYSQIAADNGQLTLAADGGEGQGSSAIIAQVDGSERLRIDDTGNVTTTLSSANTNTAGVALKLDHTTSGSSAVGFGTLIRFDGERTGSTSDGMGTLGFVADSMSASRVDGAFVVNTGQDGTYTERLRVSSAGDITSTNATGSKPVLTLENTANDANSSNLIFNKSRTATNDDILGTVRFKGNNNAGTPENTEYATIYAQSSTITDGAEDGKLIFRTMKDGTLAARLTIASNGVAEFGGGISFSQSNSSASGAAASSQILDHYEEGTFTLTDGSGAGLTLTGGAGKYTRIGNRVFISAQFSMPSVTNSNHMTLEGLPFNTDNDDDSRGLSIAYAGTSNIAYSLTVANTSKVSFYTSAGVNASNTNGSGAAFWLNGHYRVA